MLKSYRPTSPGRRQRKTLVKHEITKQKPEKSLTKAKKGSVGRSKGQVTSRFRQQGAKKHYRVVDFKRDKRDIPAVVEAIEYDPNRGPNIALLKYADGEKRYILAPEKLKVGHTVMSGENAEPNVGNSLPLGKIPLSSEIHNIEINPGQGGILARGAGNAAILTAKEGDYANIKLPSGEVKRVLAICYATIGVVGNADHRNIKHGKAGVRRHLGRRPHVRGVAMATEHPHGGKYGTTGIGMPSPKSPWGWKTRGKKTRTRKRTDRYMVSSRKKK